MLSSRDIINPLAKLQPVGSQGSNSCLILDHSTKLLQEPILYKSSICTYALPDAAAKDVASAHFLGRLS